MRIPKKLKVGGHVFTVHFVSEHASQSINTDDEAGTCKSSECAIYLERNQKRSQTEEAFLHELFHAFNNELEHQILTSLASQLYQVLHTAHMFTRIPKKLKIGGHFYRVRQVSNCANHHINTSTQRGSCDNRECVIYIDKNQTRTQKEAVLLHQILQAMNHKLDPVLSASLAEQLYQVIKDAKLFK